MGKKMMYGVEGVAKAIPKAYWGVDGVARRIKKIYYGIGDAAKLIYSGSKNYLYGGESIISWSNEIMGADGGSMTQGTDYFTVDIEKTDDVPLKIYFDDTLISTIDSSGKHTVSIDGGGTTLYNAGTLDLRIVSDSTYAISNMAFCNSWTSTDSKSTSNVIDYGVITSARMSDNVVSVGLYAFVDFSDEANIQFPPSGLIDIGPYAFSRGVMIDPSTNRGGYMPHFEIPKTVQTIGYGAFMLSKFENITIPRSVSFVDESAFATVPLSTITFEHEPEDVISFGQGIFYNVSNLETTVYHKGNAAVLSYDWAADNRTVIFEEI